MQYITVQVYSVAGVSNRQKTLCPKYLNSIALGHFRNCFQLFSKELLVNCKQI